MREFLGPHPKEEEEDEFVDYDDVGSFFFPALLNNFQLDHLESEEEATITVLVDHIDTEEEDLISVDSSWSPASSDDDDDESNSSDEAMSQSPCEEEELVIVVEGNGDGKDSEEGDPLESDSASVEGGEDIEAGTAEEPYSNPLVDEEENTKKELGGEGIGKTTYSETLVLRILLSWVKVLVPDGRTLTEAEKGDGCVEGKLSRELEEDVELLWDMSSEAEVGAYLVEKDVFLLVQKTLFSPTPDRLTEMSLGILANVLSDPTLLSHFRKVDEELSLVDTIVQMGTCCSEVPVLLQVFAVLRRLAWYLGNVERVESWLTELSAPSFISFVTFLVRGSTNATLLEDVVLVIFSLLETLLADDVPSVTAQAQTSGFATPDFVSALCEGLQELLKSAEKEEGGLETHFALSTQAAVRRGLCVLSYAQKTDAGQESLYEETEAVMKFVNAFFSFFNPLTEELELVEAVEHFVVGLDILLLCQLNLSVPSRDAFFLPVAVAHKLIKATDLAEGSSTSFLTIALQTHLEALREQFGEELMAFVDTKKLPSTIDLQLLNGVNDIQ